MLPLNKTPGESDEGPLSVLIEHPNGDLQLGIDPAKLPNERIIYITHDGDAVVVPEVNLSFEGKHGPGPAQHCCCCIYVTYTTPTAPVVMQLLWPMLLLLDCTVQRDVLKL